MSRNMLKFTDIHDGHRRWAWVDPEHVIAVVEDRAGIALHLTNGRTLLVEGTVDDVTDRILGIEPEVEHTAEPVVVSEAAAAREWARENGIEVKPVGLLPKAVLEGYRQHLLDNKEA